MADNNDIRVQEVQQVSPVYMPNAARVRAGQGLGQKPENSGATASFAEVLSEKLGGSGGVKFSKHAGARLGSRDINLTNDQLRRVENGITDAGRKGVRDSLVLVDGVALVVNVRSRTVITAVDDRADGRNVFTNIDGAVIV